MERFLTNEERTPLDSPLSLHAVDRKLDQVLAAVRDVATNQLSVLTEVRSLATRVTALERSRQLLPLAIAGAALGISFVTALWVAFRLG